MNSAIIIIGVVLLFCRKDYALPTVSLRNADCLQTMKNIKTHSVDLVLTDPPYNLGNFMRDRDTNLKQLRENAFVGAGWDDMESDEWKQSMNDFFNQAARVIRPGGSMIVFMAIIKVETIIAIAKNNGFYYKTTGIWHKYNPMPRNMNLHFINSTETWIYFIMQKRTGTFNNDGVALHDHIETATTPANEKKFGKHPTQKPEQLMEHFIGILSNEEDTVLDPFMGSGSTGVASVRLNRNFIGIEFNNNYFKIAKKRIAEVKNNAQK
jgi:site-specific DNA-methyltransferase (adenine-specific)/modification methylase